MFLFASILVLATACGLRTPLTGAFASEAARPADDVTPSPDHANPPDGRGSPEDSSDSPRDIARTDGPLADAGQDGRPPVLSDGPVAKEGRDGGSPDAAGGWDAAPFGDSQIPGSYPLAQPGHGLTDILPTIAESEECLHCVNDQCPAAITCANEALCAAEVSCLVAVCNSPSPLLPPPPMCVVHLALECDGFTGDMSHCPTYFSCSLPSLSAAITGLQAAYCVYTACYQFCGDPPYPLTDP